MIIVTGQKKLGCIFILQSVIINGNKVSGCVCVCLVLPAFSTFTRIQFGAYIWAKN